MMHLLGLLWERTWPYLGAGIATCASTWLSPTWMRSITSDLASPILNVFAIIVGFLAAVVTFLLTAQGLTTLARLRTTRAFHLLIDYHWEAIFFGFAAAVVSLVLLGSYKALAVWQLRGLFSIWMFLGAASLFSFLRVFWLLRKLLKPDKVAPN